MRQELYTVDQVADLLGLQARTEVVEENEASAEDAGGNDDIGVDGPIRELEFFGKDGAPAFGLAAGVLVADEERGVDFFEKCFERCRRFAYDESYAAVGCVFCHVAQALLEKVIRSQVGVGVVGDDLEIDHDGKGEVIGCLDGNIEGGIVDGAHCALHPVDDAPAFFARRAGAADQDAGLV